MNGPPGGSAVSGVTKMPVALMDLLAAHQLKEALLVALWNREFWRLHDGNVDPQVASQTLLLGWDGSR